MTLYMEFLVLALCNGAVALTLSKATIFRSMRKWVFSKSDFLGELIQCPYCTGHWVALFSMLIWHPRLTHCRFILVDWIATGFALVALSAITSAIIFRLFAGSHSEE